MTILQARNLRKSFASTTALQDLNLDIQSGSFFGLLGPNGAGKSTFMSIVSGFLVQDSGKLTLEGQALVPSDIAQKKKIGLSPQHIALYKELSAESNLKLFGKIYGLSGKVLSQQIEYALEVAQLSDRRKSAVKEFSGGMKRRLNIATALMHKPKILLCDEPTVGVDPQSRNAIFDTLLDLKGEGMTVVYSTHYMEEAERLCDQIGIIDAGKILRTGTLDTLLQELPRTNIIRARAASLDESNQAGFRQFGEVEPDGSSLQLKTQADFKLSHFFRWTEEQGLDASDFQIARPSLEDLFLHLTGKDLRE
ncbi:ABC transporter ATP-binding protein [Pelagicoccus sp. SDUM812002]|uniref:ABC transporter ATP-binding protein n=1 Tax=Pelagicoccus sp. SDUM812002 TaxID=3041266 RepID=UPI00280F49A5|nr:ABC transporter ATP-binding protein [Pelagicoccus sp. SDUM812002]MDQ8184789.1 ABC transporter ATP-binding protein [Pelagicoccus sp. SDUM812002]